MEEDHVPAPCPLELAAREPRKLFALSDHAIGSLAMLKFCRRLFWNKIKSSDVFIKPRSGQAYALMSSFWPFEVCTYPEHQTLIYQDPNTRPGSQRKWKVPLLCIYLFLRGDALNTGRQGKGSERFISITLRRQQVNLHLQVLFPCRSAAVSFAHPLPSGTVICADHDIMTLLLPLLAQLWASPFIPPPKLMRLS